MFRILVITNDFLPAREADWRDCGEGPFNTAQDALAFAVAEVGVPWIIVSDHQLGAVQAFGSWRGVSWTAVNLPSRMPKRKRRSPRNAELWRRID